jgi:hypothetical protein
MSKQNRSLVVRHAAIAAVLGAIVGTSAGLWSVRHAPLKATPVMPVTSVTRVTPAAAVPHATGTPVIARPSAAPPAADSSAAVARSRPAPGVPPAPSHPVSTKSVVASASPTATNTAAAVASQSRPVRTEIVDPLGRARALAQRPDVKGLVALREGFIRRAEARGDANSAETKQQLEELDRYLAEARALRLKLDAEEFRKSSADLNKPR